MKCREINSAQPIQEMTRVKQQAEHITDRVGNHLQCDSWRGLAVSIAVFLFCAVIIFLATVPRGIWLILAIAGYIVLFSFAVVAKQADDKH